MSTRILIVDDSRTIRLHVRQSLETHLPAPLQISEAEDGLVALHHLSSRRHSQIPHVIILDRNMPQITGDECIRILKQDPLWSQIPVLFLTTHSEIQEIVKGLSTLRADDYLSKPFDPQELAARIKVLLRMKQAEDQMRAALEQEKQAFLELKATKVQLAETEKIAAMTHTFEKFVPKQFLSRLAKQGIETLELGVGKNDFLTILFSDMRSFTAISESMEPESLLQFLNEYFEIMTRQIREHQGFIDKFVGDAILALFDRPGEHDSLEAADAVRSSVGMHKALRKFNRGRKQLGYDPVLAGVGIHSGPVVIGTVGVEDRMMSTVLGDSVNLAARLESATKLYGARVLISDATFRLLSHDDSWTIRELDWVRVKGKSEPLVIYEVLDADPENTRLLKAKTRGLLKEMLHLRKKQQWVKAIALCEAALKTFPQDRGMRAHLQQLKRLKVSSIPGGWDGAISLVKG